MSNCVRTLDSDSEDECVGLPGDVDDEFNHSELNNASAPQSPETARRVEKKPLGFEILGFTEPAAGPAAAGKQPAQPPKALAERLTRRTAEHQQQQQQQQQQPPRGSARKPKRAKGGGRKASTAHTARPSAAAAAIGVDVGIEPSSPAALPPPEPLPEAEAAALAGQISALGQPTVEALRSARWQHRAGALAEVHRSLFTGGLPPAGKEGVLEAIAPALAWGVADSVFHVFAAATHGLNSVLETCAAESNPQCVRSSLSPVAAALADRLSDTNGRVRQAATDCLMEMARNPTIGVAYVVRHAAKQPPPAEGGGANSRPLPPRENPGPHANKLPLPDRDADSCSPPPHENLNKQPRHGQAVSSAAGWKQLIGKMALLSLLIQDHPICDAAPPADDCIALPSVMAVAVLGLHVVNPKVRKTAVALVVDVYKKCGSAAEPYLAGVPASVLKQLKQEIEVEVCDATALPYMSIKEQEEEDLAALEPETRDGLPDVRKECLARWSALVGMRSLVCVFSKQWRLRERVFQRLLLLVENALEKHREFPDQDTPFVARQYSVTRAVFEAFVDLAEIGIQEIIPQLLVSCIEYMKPLLALYGGVLAVNDLRWHFGHIIISRLISHTSGSTSVVTQAAMSMLKTMAECPTLGVSFLSNIVLQPDHTKSGQSWKMMLARLNIICEFVKAFEFKEDALSIEPVMVFSVGAFQSPNAKIRSAAVDVIIEVYKKCGNVIRTYLRDQRPALLSDLKEKIAKVARKDRTKSAPIQTLASIVQPLGLDEGRDGGGPDRPSTFPSAFEVQAPMPEHPNVRLRLGKWRDEQKAMLQSFSVDENGVPNVVVTAKLPPRPSDPREKDGGGGGGGQNPAPPEKPLNTSRRGVRPLPNSPIPLSHTVSSDCILPQRGRTGRLVLG